MNLLIFLLFFVVSLFSTDQLAGNSEVIRLSKEDTRLRAVGFHISAVIDDRARQSQIGSIYSAGDDGKPVLTAVDLSDGAAHAFTKFMVTGHPSAAARPILIRIKECNLKEEIEASGRIEGRVDLVFQFSLVSSGNERSLVQYKASARYTRSVRNREVLEPALRRLLLNSVRFIDNWLTEHEPGNPFLAQGVSLSFSDHLEQDADTVYYDRSRPLRWTDFRGHVQSGKYAAAVYPSFGYDMERHVVDGNIEVKLRMRVYMVKSASWHDPARVNDYSLKHEQKHFDIVKIVADRFRNNLLSQQLTPDNYEGIINYEYLESYREMNRLQKQYDDETGHGTNSVVQQQWNEKIERELPGPESVSTKLMVRSPGQK